MESVKSNTGWLYPLEFDPKDYEGFIYCITNEVTGVRYIGKKVFHFMRKQKGKTRRKRCPSDWEKYYGSSEYVKEDIQNYGKENFKREIMLLIPKGYTLNYWEDMFLYQHDVLGATDARGNYLYRNERMGSYRNQSTKRRIPLYNLDNPIHRMYVDRVDDIPDGWYPGFPDYLWENMYEEVIRDA